MATRAVREIIADTMRQREHRTGFHATERDVFWMAESAQNIARLKPAGANPVDAVLEAIQAWESGQSVGEGGQ